MYSPLALFGNPFLILWDLAWMPRIFSLISHSWVGLGLLHFLTLLSLSLIWYFSYYLAVIILFTFRPGQIMNYRRLGTISSISVSLRLSA